MPSTSAQTIHYGNPSLSQISYPTPLVNPTLNAGGPGTPLPASSTHSTGLPLPLGVPRPIYSYIRNFEGITGYKTFPDPARRGSPLGLRADEYFTAHGYQAGTVNLIQQTYETATGMNEFVDQLSGRGLPITEARYIYNLICDN